MGKRLLAFVIDQVAYLIVGGGFIAASVLDQVHGGDPVPAALVPDTPLALVGYALLAGLGLFQWWYQGTRGFTLGKRAVGLRTLSAATGQPAGMVAILVRRLVAVAGSLVLGIGQLVVYASPFFDTSGWRRGWHDKAAGTIVYDIQIGIDPATADAGVGAPVAVPPCDVPQHLEVAPPPWLVARPVNPPRAGSLAGSLAGDLAEELADDVEMTRLTATPALSTPLLRSPAERFARPRLQATLQLWDGRSVLLEGTALIGRSPAPRAGEVPPNQLLEAVDPGHSVSKTHLAIGVDPDGVWLRDRNSTNGTVVTLPDGSQILCAPEQRVQIPAGSSVAFGDCWLAVVDDS